MKILTQMEAEILGSKFFFTGKPCGNGHISKRYTSCNICVQCVNDRRERRREYLKEQSREYHRKHPERHRKLAKEWRLKNLDYVRRYMRQYMVAYRARLKTEQPI